LTKFIVHVFTEEDGYVKSASFSKEALLKMFKDLKPDDVPPGGIMFGWKITSEEAKNAKKKKRKKPERRKPV